MSEADTIKAEVFKSYNQYNITNTEQLLLKIIELLERISNK